MHATICAGAATGAGADACVGGIFLEGVCTGAGADACAGVFFLEGVFHGNKRLIVVIGSVPVW